MSRISVSKKVIDELMHGYTDCIKKHRLYFNSMVIAQDQIVYYYGKKKVASFPVPHYVDFSRGDTLTVQLSGSMRVELQDSV